MSKPQYFEGKFLVWKLEGNTVTMQAKGVIGMNLVGCNIEGAVDEALYGYLSGAGTMKGTVLIEEI